SCGLTVGWNIEPPPPGPMIRQRGFCGAAKARARARMSRQLRTPRSVDLRGDAFIVHELGAERTLARGHEHAGLLVDTMRRAALLVDQTNLHRDSHRFSGLAVH